MSTVGAKDFSPLFPAYGAHVQNHSQPLGLRPGLQCIAAPRLNKDTVFATNALRNLLHFFGSGGAYDSLSHGCSVDHLFDRNRESWPPARSLCKGIQCDAADVECVGLPDFGLAFRRLK